MARRKTGATVEETEQAGTDPAELLRVINYLLGGLATAHSMALQAADGKVSPDSFIMSVGTVLETLHNRGMAELQNAAGGPDPTPPAVDGPPSPAMLDLFRSRANGEFFDALIKAHAACGRVHKERTDAGADGSGHFAVCSSLSVLIKNIYDGEIVHTRPGG